MEALRVQRVPRACVVTLIAGLLFVSPLLAQQDEVTSLLQQYVRIDTSNPPGNTTKAADFLAGVLQREGIAVTRYEPEPGKSIVSLYRAAPGKQVELLKWMAAQDRASVAAGVAASQIYVHTSGDSWDYLVINPVTTEAQDVAVEAAQKKMGMPSGPRASIQFRTMIGSHTDTYATGPQTAAEILAVLSEK